MIDKSGTPLIVTNPIYFRKFGEHET